MPESCMTENILLHMHFLKQTNIPLKAVSRPWRAKFMQLFACYLWKRLKNFQSVSAAYVILENFWSWKQFILIRYLNSSFSMMEQASSFQFHPSY